MFFQPRKQPLFEEGLSFYPLGETRGGSTQKQKRVDITGQLFFIHYAFDLPAMRLLLSSREAISRAASWSVTPSTAAHSSHNTSFITL